MGTLGGAQAQTAAPAASTAEQLVDSLEGVFGARPGFRRSHGLQVFCLGLFLSLAVSAQLERFPHQASWLDPVVVLAGTATLAGFARMHDQRRAPLARPMQAGQEDHVGSRA